MSAIKLLTHFEQGSQEWFDIRVGKLTSSSIVHVVKTRQRKTRKEDSEDEPLKARVNLRRELAVERITKKPIDHFVSRWMQEGKEKEDLARAAYECRKDVQTRKIGFALRTDLEWVGASPDGLCGEDGLVEFKCPKPDTHFEYLLLECIPEAYIPQMMWQMACTGREWCDFVSYHEDFPEPIDLIIHRLHRDHNAIAVMEAQAAVFLKEVADEVLRGTHGLEGMLRESVAVTNPLVPRAVIPAWEESAGMGNHG